MEIDSTVSLIEEYHPFFKKLGYKGREIILLDFANFKPEEVIEAVPKASEVMRTFSANSV